MTAPLNFPSVPPNLKGSIFRGLVPVIKTQGTTGGASTITVTFIDPLYPRGVIQEDVYCRVRVTNVNTLANSTNATIAPSGGCTTVETHTSTKDLTMKSCVLTQATQTLTSDNTNVAAGETVTIGTKPYTFVAVVAATGTLTSDNTAPADGDTVTIGTKVYTFKTSLTPTEGEVLINSTADAALLNLIRAINHTGTPNTDYKCAAANAFVTAASSVTTHAFAITAITAGTGGNSVVTTETSAHLSFGAVTLTGGLQPVVEGDVKIGADADASLLNLIRAINHSGTPGTDYVCGTANPDVSAATAVTSHTFVVTGRGGTAGNAIATTETSAHLSWGAALLTGGLNQIPGVIQFALTDATAETVTVRMGRPLVGGHEADYSQKLNVTHAA